MKKRHCSSGVLSHFLNAFHYLDVYFVLRFGGGKEPGMSTGNVMKRRNELLRRAAVCAEYRADTLAAVIDVCGLESIPHLGDFSVHGDVTGIADLRGLAAEGNIVLKSAGSGRLDRIAMTARGLKVVAELEKSWWKKIGRRIGAVTQKMAEMVAGVDAFARCEAAK